jgi:hypothetical protein
MKLKHHPLRKNHSSRSPDMLAMRSTLADPPTLCRSVCLPVRLTCRETASTVALFAAPKKPSKKDHLHDAHPHFRPLSLLLLSRQCSAGVSVGFNAEASSDSHRPTRQTARWVFYVQEFFHQAIPGKSTGGEVANAQVCKTCIRGFESRPVLQISLQPGHASHALRHWRAN